ncbi:flavin reductase family protein [Actinoplanes sp. NPDC023936]|uniref:flavin reductase family protein n=1 Tax=Actinoplanes sp. NPDC023936 TaxID=3154910 RepID=UPI0033EC83C3
MDTATIPEIPQEVFRDVLGTFATGVTVVTAPEATGATVNSFTSVSLDPPLVAFCLRCGSRTGASVRRHRRFAISILSRDQQDVCQRFARAEPDRSPAARQLVDAAGVPVVRDALAHLTCTLSSIQRYGDHDLVVGQVRAAQAPRAGEEPLIFFRGGYR